MANKYLIHGATYCGDGTASNEAASAGAAGAWNNINVFTGTAPAYGSLAAGDTVYIRSKTSAGADITITPSAGYNLGSTSAVIGSKISWVLDGGDIWSGISGTLTITPTNNSLGLVRDYNDVIAYAADKFVMTCDAVSFSTNLLNVGRNCTVKNVLFDTTAATNYSSGGILLYFGAKLINPHWIQGTYTYGNGIFNATNYTSAFIINPDIELTTIITKGVFDTSAFGSYLHVIGGRVSGTGAAAGSYVSSGFQGFLNLVGFDAPVAMNQYRLSNTSLTSGCGINMSIAPDSGFGTTMSFRSGDISSRNDGNFPTLNAVLPDSGSTPWSYYFAPTTGCSEANPMYMYFNKVYTDSDSVKTLVLNLQLADSFTTANKNAIYIVCNYIDASTGTTVTVESDRSVASLAASSAVWSADSYGPVSLLAKEITVTTPSAVKQNTTISIALFVEATPISVGSDIFFICPDIQFA